MANVNFTPEQLAAITAAVQEKLNNKDQKSQSGFTPEQIAALSAMDEKFANLKSAEANVPTINVLMPKKTWTDHGIDTAKIAVGVGGGILFAELVQLIANAVKGN